MTARPVGVVPLGMILLWCACQPGATPPPARHPVALEITPREFQWRDPQCSAKPTDNCSTLLLSYPQFAATGGELAARANEVVIGYIRTLSPGDPPAHDDAALAAAFAQQLRDEQRPGETLLPWSIERTVAVVAETPIYLTLRGDEQSYLGGAHPNSSARWFSLRRDTGAAITLRDLFGPTIPELVRAAGERALRQARDIPAGQSLAEAGFNFPDDKFRFNDNCALVADGLACHIDPYEVAPYAVGPSDFTIPLGEIEAALRVKPLVGDNPPP